jgi:hypothetical protein
MIFLSQLPSACELNGNGLLLFASLIVPFRLYGTFSGKVIPHGLQ